MMQYHQQQRQQTGYSIIEVLVSIAILLIAIVGPMTIASRSLQHANFVAEQNTAQFLAQEGIEAVVRMRQNYALRHFKNPSSGPAPWNWIDNTHIQDCFDAGGCGVDWANLAMFTGTVDCDDGSNLCRLYYNESDGRAPYSHEQANAVPTPFTRVVTIHNVDGNTVEVTVTVSWETNNQTGTQQVILRTYLHDIYG